MKTETSPAPTPSENHRQPHSARRNGSVARLPRHLRDMVNRMLDNGIPYGNIVAALGVAGYTVTERNISNWTTGGYLDWQHTQELSTESRLNQDALLAHLRSDYASELPEVGLQAAATRLSQSLVQKAAQAGDLEPNLRTFAQMVDLLCRLNREIVSLQKYRDESRCALGEAHDPGRIQQEEAARVREWERYYSDPPADSGLPKPATPPVLPAVPTSALLALQEQAEELRDQEKLWNMIKACQPKT